MKKIYLGVIIITMFFGAGVFLVKAQEVSENQIPVSATEEGEDGNLDSEEMKDEAVIQEPTEEFMKELLSRSDNSGENCLDFYPKNSLGATVSFSSKNVSNSFEAGKEVEYDINIENKSKIFIPDARIVLLLEKLLDGEGKIDEKLIQEEILKESIALNAGEKKSFTYKIKLPEKMENGSYGLKAIALKGMNINERTTSFGFYESLAGGTKSQFEIKNQSVGNSKLIIQGTKINENSYYQGIKVGLGKNSFIQTLENVSQNDKNIKVKYDLFKVNYYSEENKIDSSSQEISIPAGKTGEIVYSEEKIKENPNLPYYLRTEIEYPEGKIIKILSVNDSSLSHIAFLDKFPLKVGEKSQLIFCLSRGDVFPLGKMKVKMVIKDQKGNEIFKMEKSDDGEKGVLISFEKAVLEIKKEYTTLSLESWLYDGEKLVDKNVVIYENPNKEEKVVSESGKKNNWIKNILLGAFALALVIILIFFVKKKKSSAIVGIFILALSLAGFFGGAKISLGATTYDFKMIQESDGRSPPLGCSEDYSNFPQCALNYDGNTDSRNSGNKGWYTGALLSFRNLMAEYEMKINSNKEFTPNSSENKLVFSSGVVSTDYVDFGFKTSASGTFSKSAQLYSTLQPETESENRTEILSTPPLGGLKPFKATLLSYIDPEPGSGLKVGVADKNTIPKEGYNLEMKKMNTMQFFAGGAQRRTYETSSPYAAEAAGVIILSARPHSFTPSSDNFSLSSYLCSSSNIGMSAVATCRGATKGLFAENPLTIPGRVGRMDVIPETDKCRHWDKIAEKWVEPDHFADAFDCKNGTGQCSTKTGILCSNTTNPTLRQCYAKQCYDNSGKFDATGIISEGDDGIWDRMCRIPLEQAKFFRNIMGDKMADRCNNNESWYLKWMAELINDQALKDDQKRTSLEIIDDPSGIINNCNNEGKCFFNAGKTGTAKIKIILPEKKYLSATHSWAVRNSVTGLTTAEYYTDNFRPVVKGYGYFDEESETITIVVEPTTTPKCACNILTNNQTFKDYPDPPTFVSENLCTTGDYSSPSLNLEGTGWDWSCAKAATPASCSIKSTAPIGASCTYSSLTNSCLCSTSCWGSCSSSKCALIPASSGCTRSDCYANKTPEAECAPIECTDALKEKYCEDKPIPDGCPNSTCFGTLACEQDARCCNDGWIEVKP